MIITTSQEAALVDCCGCPPPSCAIPRKECESISSSCFYVLPELDGVRPCSVYKTKTSVYRIDADWSDTTGHDRLQTYVHTYTTTYTMGEACVKSYDATTVEYLKQVTWISGQKYPETIYNNNSGEATGVACHGSRTTTTEYEPDPISTYTEGPACNATELYVDAGFTKTGLVYTKVVNDLISGQTGTATTTFSITYSDEEDLASYSFPGDANGSSCTALRIVGLSGGTLRKSRYRFGVPVGYSTVDSPRTYYEAQWDEVFFPTTGDPVLIASRSWLWGGSMESPWSSWFDLALPTECGEVRVVNLLIKCYKSARLGVKPTAVGEVYVFPA